MRIVIKALASIPVLLVGAFAVMMLQSAGHGGILIRSTPGRFRADTTIYNELLKQNLEARGFHKCDYFTGIATFTTLEGLRCPWYTTEDPRISNIRERAD